MARMKNGDENKTKVWENKSPAMKKMLEAVFPQRMANIAKGLCAQCESPKIEHDDFKNDISRKEFTLTGWCQKCQDAFFKHD